MHGLYSRQVSNQEWAIMVQVWWTLTLAVMLCIEGNPWVALFWRSCNGQDKQQERDYESPPQSTLLSPKSRQNGVLRFVCHVTPDELQSKAALI